MFTGFSIVKKSRTLPLCGRCSEIRFCEVWICWENTGNTQIFIFLRSSTKSCTGLVRTQIRSNAGADFHNCRDTILKFVRPSGVIRCIISSFHPTNTRDCIEFQNTLLQADFTEDHGTQDGTFPLDASMGVLLGITDESTSWSSSTGG